MKDEQAIIKFNNGAGALLCNKCHVIIATGFRFENKLHFCDKHKEERIKNEIGRIAQ